MLPPLRSHLLVGCTLLGLALTGAFAEEAKTKVFEIVSKKHQKTTIAWTIPGKTPNAFFYRAGMSTDYDGAPNAYHPGGRKAGALDATANAGHPGNWWGIVTENGKKDGNPVVQGPDDPCPGFYVSCTSLADPTKKPSDPRRYVDASKVPYFVLPGGHSGGAVLGDFAAVVNLKTDKVAFAIYADVGPSSEIGEGSAALGEALGRKRGEDLDLVYVVFPGSGNRKPRSADEINEKGGQLFKAWGGVVAVRGTAPWQSAAGR
jgi:hypothetical protein